MDDLVTVVIPCYNQGHYLGEAIESALGQTYPSVEVVVVDDGSTDDTAEVAAGYPGVQCFRQANQGPSAARNEGLRRSRGDCVVFLDADDRLRPGAVEAGVSALRSHPECAFVYGHYVNIAADGSPLASPKNLTCAWSNQYAALLRVNHIANPAMVMYRRSVFDALGGFDPAFHPSEDHDIYLRIARKFPIHCHHGLVAEYRRHGGCISRNHMMMLASQLKILDAQAGYVRGKGELEVAWEQGGRQMRFYYGEMLFAEAVARIQSGELRQAASSISALLRFSPRRLVSGAGRQLQRIVLTGRWNKCEQTTTEEGSGR